jgi:hypothetical protein
MSYGFSRFIENVYNIEKSARPKFEIADVDFVLCPHILCDAEFLMYEVNIIRAKYGLRIDSNKENNFPI